MCTSTCCYNATQYKAYKTKKVRKEERIEKSGQNESFGRVVWGLKPRHMLAWQDTSVQLTGTKFPTQNLDTDGSSAVNLILFYNVIDNSN